MSVSANGYDMRPGGAFGNNGCMDSGCQPGLTRDGDSEVDESRWSCTQGIVPDGDLCAITFSFDEPQDIEYIQVAFWKADERFRSLQVKAAVDNSGTRHKRCSIYKYRAYFARRRTFILFM